MDSGRNFSSLSKNDCLGCNGFWVVIVQLHVFGVESSLVQMVFVFWTERYDNLALLIMLPPKPPFLTYSAPSAFASAAF
jgi:hypothetical protein